MLVILAMTAGFCWIGATAREFDRRVARQLLLLIVVVIALDYARGIV